MISLDLNFKPVKMFNYGRDDILQIAAAQARE